MSSPSFIPRSGLYANAPRTFVEHDRRLKQITREFRIHINDHQSQLARQLDIRSQTVNNWFKKGLISPWGAIAIGKVMPDWPRERLRPDIIDWSFYENNAPGTRRRR